MNVAETLIADPTYRLMTPAERIDEARALMRTAGLDDDPLDAAEAVEAADALLASGAAPALCEPPPGFLARYKANRDARLFGKRVDPATVFIAAPGLSEPPPGFLARYKASSGNNDRVIAELIGKGRSTVQAMVGGAVPEHWAPSALAAVAASIDSQVKALAALRAELGR